MTRIVPTQQKETLSQVKLILAANTAKTPPTTPTIGVPAFPVQIIKPECDFSPQHPLIQAFYDGLPAKVRTTQNKGTSFIRYRDTAFFGEKDGQGMRITPYPYIQPNHPDYIRWLVFDIDYSTVTNIVPNSQIGSVCNIAYDEHDCPPPNIIAVNPENGHAHYFYMLKDPVYRGANAEPKPALYLESIYANMRTKLRADPCFAGVNAPLVKNPNSYHWNVFIVANEPYALCDLDVYVPTKKHQKKKINTDTASLGRNCALFEELRKYAYAAVADFDSLDMFIDHLYQQAQEINAKNQKRLYVREVKDVAKSIARYCFQKGFGEEFIKKQAEKGRKGGKIGGKISKRPKDPNSARSKQPWVELGISRATYYRDLKKMRTILKDDTK